MNFHLIYSSLQLLVIHRLIQMTVEHDDKHLQIIIHRTISPVSMIIKELT